MSSDGQHSAFDSSAPLVADDTNGVYDVFVHTPATPAPNTQQVTSVTANVSFPGRSGGTAGATIYVQPFGLFGIVFFYWGTVTYADPNGKTAGAFVITNQIYRYGVNGAQFTGFGWKDLFTVGNVTVRVDDLSALGGTDLIWIVADGGLAYYNAAAATGGDVVVH